MARKPELWFVTHERSVHLSSGTFCALFVRGRLVLRTLCRPILLLLFLMGDACVFTTKPALPLTEDAAFASDGAFASYDVGAQADASSDAINSNADNCRFDPDAGVNGAYRDDRGEVCDPTQSPRDGGSDAARDASSDGDVADGGDVADDGDVKATDLSGSDRP
jgi:hypothetical protein